MTPIADIGVREAAAVHTLITDIDDTLTTDGVLTAGAYSALERLRRSGLRVIVTTGRPAGWCDHIARMWPVDAVVGENGAVCFWYDHKRRVLATRHSLAEDELRANRERIDAVAREVLRSVPGTALASDQFCRLYDLAVDYCEDVPHIGDDGVNLVVSIMQAAGMTAKVSSIHVNGWFGTHDKLSMSRQLLRENFGVDIDVDRDRIVYAGDSPNDAPMFGHFPLSVGVANVRDFASRMDALPAYITRGRSGEGFSELASLLISMQRQGA